MCGRWACGLAVLLTLTSAASADGPFVLTRTFNLSFSAEPTYSDYNGDGIDDIVLWPGGNSVQLIDGNTGATLRTFTGQTHPTPSFGWSFAPLRHTGGAHSDFLIGAPAYLGGAVYALPANSPGGSVDTLPLLYRINPDPVADGYMGWNLAATAGTAGRTLVGWGDASKMIVANAATGVTVARLTTPTTTTRRGFGTTVGPIGDLTGDGIEDFAIGGPAPNEPINHGGVYLIDGAVATAAAGFVPVNNLGTSLLATLEPTTLSTLGSSFGDEQTITSLGDPHPGNGVREALVVVGTPDLNFPMGGFAAFHVAQGAGGSFTATSVAEFTNTGNGNTMGSDVLDVGDLDADGVDDLALFAKGTGLSDRGEIDIVSGLKLLDGYQPTADLIQSISDPVYTLSGNLRFMGNYDGIGGPELMVSTGGPTNSVRIYSVVPEPAGVVGALAVGGVTLFRCRRRSRV
jgi:hypothetical protein